MLFRPYTFWIARVKVFAAQIIIIKWQTCFLPSQKRALSPWFICSPGNLGPNQVSATKGSAFGFDNWYRSAKNRHSQRARLISQQSVWLSRGTGGLQFAHTNHAASLPAKQSLLSASECVCGKNWLRPPVREHVPRTYLCAQRCLMFGRQVVQIQFGPPRERALPTDGTRHNNNCGKNGVAPRGQPTGRPASHLMQLWF